MNSNYINRIFQNDLSLTPINHSIDWSDWVVLSLCVITLLISRIFNFEYINTFHKKKTDFYSTNKASVYSLVINFILTASFFLKQVITTFNFSNSFFNNNSTLIYLTLFLTISGIIILKFLTLYILRILFNTKYSFTIYYHLKYYQIIGLLILPLFLFTYFIQIEIKSYVFLVALIIYGLLIIIREVEIFLTALKQKISLLYIILYLCTLEILPLILFIKILVG